MSYSGPALNRLSPVVDIKGHSGISSVSTLDLRDLKALLLRRRWWLLFPAITGLLIGFVWSITSIPNYVATAQVLIDPRGLQVIEGSLTPGNAQVTDGSLVVVESQAGVIVSQGNLTRVVKEQRLTTDPDFDERRSLLAPIGDAVRAVLGIERAKDAAALVALRELQKKTTVKRGEKSYVVDITVETDDRFKSARIANSVADIYLDGETQSRTIAAQRASQSLIARLDELRERVRVAEEKSEAYKAQKKLVGAGGRLISDQQLSDLNTQLGIAQNKASETKTRYEQVRRVQLNGLSPDAVAESLQSGVITQLRSQYAEVRRRQAEVTAHLGTRHPDIAQMEAQIRSQGTLIQQELTRITRSAQLDYERANAEVISVSSKLDRLKSQATEVSHDFVQLRELEREVDTSRKIYEAFSKRAREIGEQQAIDTSTTRKISEATPPKSPKGFGMPELALLGTLGGLCVGAAAGILRDQLATSLQSRRQLGMAVELPILATVPSLRTYRNGKPWSQRKALPQSEYAARFGVPVLDGTTMMALYRLDRHIAHEHSRNTLAVLVTAPTPASGLSAATLCWAQAAAQDGRRVLVIDAHGNRDRPIARRDVESQPGLTDVIQTGLPLTAALRHDESLPLAWLERGSGTLRVVPSVSVLQQAVLAQTEAYDLILVEVGNIRTDVTIANWAEATDAIVLAVEESRTQLVEIAASVQALRTFGQKVHGTIYVGDA